MAYENEEFAKRLAENVAKSHSNDERIARSNADRAKKNFAEMGFA